MQGYVESIFLAFDEVSHSYIYNGYEALAHKINYIIAPMIILAIVFKGYKMWFESSIKVSEFWKFTVKVAVIYTIGLNWGQFSSLFMGLFQGSIDQFGSALLEANPLHIPGVTSINMSLQLTSNIIGFISGAVFEQAGFSHIGLFFYGGVIWIVGYAMIIIAMFEMIIAKIMMAVLFTVAPIMFVCLLFEYTKGIFDRWIGNLIGYTVLLIMISAMLGLIMGIIYEFMPITAVTSALPSSFFKGLAVGVVPMVICLFVAIYGMTKLSSMAMHIGGGAASSGMGGVIGGMMVGKMMSMGSSPLNSAGRKATDHSLSQLGKLAGFGGSKVGGALKSGLGKVRDKLK